MFLKKHFYIISIGFAGLLLRLYHLTSISLWHDEAFSALLIRYNWSEMMYRIGLDVHPPMYYIFLRLWHYILGDSIWSLRGFSVFFGVLIIPLAYIFVKEIFKSEKAALFAALFVALSPFQIQYVTEARMYTMGAFFGLLSAYFLVKALREDSIGYYILFSAAIAISILTHYYLLFTGAAICFYALVFHIYTYKGNYGKYKHLLLSYFLIAFSFLPWLKVFLFQYKQVGAGYWIPPIDRWSIPTTVWQMLIGWNKDINLLSTKVLVAAALLFSLYFLYQFVKKNIFFEKWLVIFCVLAPFAGAIAFFILSSIKGSGSSVYLVRYFLFASPFFSIALAIWLDMLSLKKIIPYFVVIYCAISLWTVYHYWDDLNVKIRPGMASASAYLEENVKPSDKLYVGSSFEFFNFKYYNQTPAKPLLYSGGVTDIHELPHYAGTAILTNDDLLPDFNTSVTNGDSVWLLWTNGFGGSKPTVPANWVQTEEKNYPDVRPYVGTSIYVTKYQIN